MAVTLELHVELADDGEVVWWAESEQLPGFSAAAPTLVELRERSRVAISDLTGETTVLERLAVG